MMANQNQQKVPDLVPINGSTNVYVGQRYVPKFYDDGTEQHGATWDKTKVYEPLTIVLWEGDSYTSRTFVPVGVEITNTLYWLKTGAFNAQLESYKKQLDNYGSLLKPINEKFTANDAIITGDSYLNSEFGDIPSQLATLLNATKFYDCHVSGGSFSASSFISAITAQAETMTEDERNNIKWVVCIAGINDATEANTSGSQLETKVADYCKKSNSLFPNAKCYIAFAGNSKQNSDILNGRDYRYIPLAINAYANGCKNGGVFLNNIQYILHDYSLMAADGIHPSQEGANKIAEGVAAAINGGFTVERYKSFNINTAITAEGRSTSISNLAILTTPVTNDSRFVISQSNGVQTVEIIYNLGVIFANEVKINNVKELVLGTLECDYWNGKGGLSIPVSGYSKDSANNHYVYSGRILINGGTIYLRSDYHGPSWEQNIDVTQILLNPISVCFSTLMF